MRSLYKGVIKRTVCADEVKLVGQDSSVFQRVTKKWPTVALYQ